MSAPRLLLCADDYGLAPGIGRGIRTLVERGRLSAVSCMTIGPFWPDEARRLREVAAGVQVGLHLTLTDQPPLGAMPRTAPAGRLPSFGALLRAAYLRRLALDELRAEIGRQLDAFTAAFGRAPGFVDGHHHAQQLPGVRALVTEAVAERLQRGPWVRTCAEPLGTILGRGVDVPRAVSFAIPARPLRARLRRAGIATNAGYSGAYDFTPRRPYGELFDRFLAGTRDGSLVNCHPGEVDDALRERDGLTTQREVELSFLAGPLLDDALSRRAVALWTAKDGATPPRAGR